MKKYLYVAIFVVCLILAITLPPMIENVGFAPSYEEMYKYKNSKQLDSELLKFKNKIPELFERMRIRNLDWKVISDWFLGFEQQVPSKKLPEEIPHLFEFSKEYGKIQSIWLGHSTILVNFYGEIILFDPVFSEAASPVRFMVRRFQPPVITINDIPKVDYVVISHDHYDHLDMDSIKQLKKIARKFIVPLGVKKYLEYWGVDGKKIIELDWWDEVEFNGITFAATPAQHFSGRSGFWNNTTLWASWVVTNKEESIFFSGDSGYGEHFKTIGHKYGPFELAFIENGQYNLRWKEVHMLPEEGVKAFKDLKAKNYFPIHWGMFDLALHTWDEPIITIFNLAQDNKINLVAPKLGEIYTIGSDYDQEQWWSPTE